MTVTRHRVVILLEQGKSQAEILRRTGVSRCGIQALLKKHHETGQVEDQPRSGRPRKLSKSDEKYLNVTSLIERTKYKQGSCCTTCSNFGTQVHLSTIRRTLVRNGLHSRVAVRKPLLRKGNKTKRLTYAWEHNNWNSDQWKVLSSDNQSWRFLEASNTSTHEEEAGKSYKNPVYIQQ